VIRPGAIGDVVCALPAIEHLEPTEIWAPAPVLPLLRHIAPARSIASTGIDRLEIPGQPAADVINRLSGFDEIVSWYGSNREEFRAAAAGHGLNVRFLPALPGAAGEDEIAHAADFFLRAAGGPPGGIPRLPFRGAPETWAAIHPFSGSPRKNWPIERFEELARSLAGSLDVQWCAGPEEELHGAHRFQDLAGVGAWLSRAAIYIGNDSGISHMAAACGVPVIALFGPTDPRIWAPRGERVRVFPFSASVASIARAAVAMARIQRT
jgi:ADP-heptose:LPS heptosyltransferase